jgi:hypothetical protein
VTVVAFILGAWAALATWAALHYRRRFHAWRRSALAWKRRARVAGWGAMAAGVLAYWQWRKHP